MNKYIISVDGGGTKTHGVLYNFVGETIYEATSGYSNFYVNETIARMHLFQVLDQLTKDLEKPFELVIVLGISGSTGTNKSKLEAEINQKYHASCYLYSDDVLALHSIKKNEDKNVILMIGGTGSSITYTKGEQIAQIGGFGHLLGDEGSAYHASIQALKYVIKQIESGETLSFLSKEILSFIKGTGKDDIKSFVYNHEKTDIAKVATIIDKCAKAQDEFAQSIIFNEAKEAARQIIYAYRNMGEPKDLIIALRGGFITKAYQIDLALKQALDKKIKHYQLDTQAILPTIGGYYMGLKILEEGDC